MKILTTPTGTKIVVRHVVTVDYGVDSDGYRTDSFAHYKGELEIRKSQRHSEHEDQLKTALAEAFPNGKPRMKDYYRTKVTTTDGHTYWVEQELDAVVRAVLDAS